MAPMQFPAPEIHHCHSCGCQQWFYPESYPAPKFILCWRCRGAVFSHGYEDVQPVTGTSVTRVCVVCGADISHLRPQAQTCSAKCRKAYSRQSS